MNAFVILTIFITLLCGNSSARWWGEEDGAFYYTSSSYLRPKTEMKALLEEFLAAPVITSLEGVYEVYFDSKRYVNVLDEPPVRRAICNLWIPAIMPDRVINVPPGGNGAFVEKVEPSSPEAEAGILAGDIICKINGQDIKDGYEFSSIFNKLTADIRISYVLWRGGEMKEIEFIPSGPPGPRQYEIRWAEGPYRSSKSAFQIQYGSKHLKRLDDDFSKIYVEFSGFLYNTKGILGYPYREQMISIKDAEGNVKGIFSPQVWEPEKAEPVLREEWSKSIAQTIASHGLESARLTDFFREGNAYLLEKNGERILAHIFSQDQSDFQIEGVRVFPRSFYRSKPKNSSILCCEVYFDRDNHVRRVDIAFRFLLPKNTIKKYFAGDYFDLKRIRNSVLFSDYHEINGVAFPMRIALRRDRRLSSDCDRRIEQQALLEGLSEAEKLIRLCPVTEEEWIIPRYFTFEPKTVRVNDLDSRDFSLNFPPGTIIESPRNGLVYMVGAPGQSRGDLINSLNLREDHRIMALLYTFSPMTELDTIHVSKDCRVPLISWTKPPQLGLPEPIKDVKPLIPIPTIGREHITPMISVACAIIAALAITILVVIKVRG